MKRSVAVVWLFLLTACDATLAAAPVTRIVSLAPNLTELAFAAGAGDRVVGTVEYSDYPEAARAIPRVGDAFRVDYERVLALRPEAILAWEPGTPVGVVERLTTLHLNIATIRTRRIADISAGVRQIGRIAATESAAEPVADAFEHDIAALRQQYAGRPPVSVFLQINDRPLYTVNGRQIMSEVIELCGGRNVFADLSDIAPQVGVEAVIAADPDAIVVTGDAGSEALDRWQRWQHVRAVRTGNLFAVPPDDLARPTTRLARGADALCRILQTARERLREKQ